MKLPIVYPAANMTNLEWMAGQVIAGVVGVTPSMAHRGWQMSDLAAHTVEIAKAILVEVQKAERELPDLGD